MRSGFLFIILIVGVSGCAGTKAGVGIYSGGATTSFDDTDLAFQRPLSNLATERLRDFTFGHRLFKTNWVIAPSSTSKFDGLGPIFNRVSCSACHVFDGRGQPPAHKGDTMDSMLIRLSLPGKGPHGEVISIPNYGDQLRDRSILGVPVNGRAVVHYKEEAGQYPDGETYSLRVPQYEFTDMYYGPLGDDFLFSPRVSPAVHGLGLLETVPEKTILSFARIQQRNKDGVKGQPNYVWDVEHRQRVLGRFGWKANQPDLRQQIAGAFSGDIGITNPIFPRGNIPDVQTKAKEALNGGTPEIDEEFFKRIVFYIKTIAPPARRNVEDRQVIAGEKIFRHIDCTACHIPTMKTGKNKNIPELSHQTIHPFTDLLLHDMGEGLADHRPDFEANGRQWRTPPLWGIGLVKTVNKHTFFLHDGRARNLEEAILWHDGEAKASQKKFKELSKEERQRLISFLESL